MRVRIKVGGVLQATLQKLIVEKQTRSQQLRSSAGTGWNIQRLLMYGLLKREAKYSRKAEAAVEARYARRKVFTKVLNKRLQQEYKADLRRYNGLDGALGLLPTKPLRPLSFTYFIPTRSLRRGCERPRYTVTKAGIEVFRALNAYQVSFLRCDRYLSGKRTYAFLVVEVPGNKRWQEHFKNQAW